jgi:O-antigen ligase
MLERHPASISHPGAHRGRVRPPAATAGSATARVPAVFFVRARDIWSFVKRQPASFVLVCLYLFMEYVRPQQLYTAISGPPYSKFIIAFALIAFVMEGRFFRLGLAELLLGLFTAIVLASSFFALSPDDSFAQLSIFLSWALIYLLITNCVDTEERFLVFALSFILYSFKMAEFGTRSWLSDGFRFRSWGINGAPGWFSNSGEYGIQMCIFIPIVFYFTRSLNQYWPRWKRYVFWSMPVCAVIGIVGSSSRGALVGLAAVALWMLSKTRYKVRGLVAAAILAAAVYWVLPAEQMQRLQDMGTDDTSISRTTMWARGLELMREYPFLGIGYKNWSPYSKIHFGTPLLPHNIFIEAGSELGYTGLIMFVVLIIATLVINYRTRRLMRQLPADNRFMLDMAHGLDGALIGYLASGFFVTVLYYPFFWINYAMTVALYNAARKKANGLSAGDAGHPRGRRRGHHPPLARGSRAPVRSSVVPQIRG